MNGYKLVMFLSMLALVNMVLGLGYAVSTRSIGPDAQPTIQAVTTGVACQMTWDNLRGHAIQETFSLHISDTMQVQSYKDIKSFQRDLGSNILYYGNINYNAVGESIFYFYPTTPNTISVFIGYCGWGD